MKSFHGRVNISSLILLSLFLFIFWNIILSLRNSSKCYYKNRFIPYAPFPGVVDTNQKFESKEFQGQEVSTNLVTSNLPESVLIASVEDIVNGSTNFPRQDDIRVINYIRKNHLQLPADQSLPYNIRYPIHNGGVVQYVTKLFNNMTGGFFVECGAMEGEYLSNSLLLERYYNWTGLLVEGDKDSFNKLRTKNRKAFLGNFCLSPEPYPVKLNLEKSNDISMTHLLGYYFLNGTNQTKFGVQCFPLYSVLSALEVKVVDFFSLDVEGAELPILKTFPFDGSIVIKVLSVEYRNNNLTEFDAFLESKGYTRTSLITEAGHTLDAVYVHASFNK